MIVAKIGSAGIVALLLLCAVPAFAWVVPAGASRGPLCPAIPDATDVKFSAEEMARIEAGEIVIRLADFGEFGRRAWAAGYLDANPAWIFDVGTDSRLAEDLVDIIERVEVLERREHGKVMYGVADVSILLPAFDYTLAVSYLEDATGQCWAQIEGDFKTNEGAHSYFWDPVRRQTLAVISYEMSLKGVLSIIPDDLIQRLSARTLPNYMRRLESLAARLEVEDPSRAERVERRWTALRTRLEANELPGRVWRGSRAQSADAAVSIGGGAAAQ